MKTSDMPVIELNGTPRERGRIYGESAKSLIAEIVQQWRSDLGNFLSNSTGAQVIDSDDYLKEFLSKNFYINAIEQWSPHLLEEVKGMAEASEQDYEHILGLQLFDEEWVYGLRRRLDKPTTKCTAFGVPDQQKGISYAGQNMDIPDWTEGRQVLLRIKTPSNTHERDTESLLFSIAGSIGLNGINNHGVGITCNTLAQLDYSIHGLPVLFIVRSVLEKESIDEAEHFLRCIKHASGQNYILSSPGEMRCFECSGSHIVRYTPKQLHGRVFHSNHPLVNDDLCNVLQPEKMRSQNSVARLDSICNRLGDTSKLVGLEDVKAALSAHDDSLNPVSRPGNNDGNAIGYTAGSSIYEFSDKPRLHLAAGPPCITDFKTFEFQTH